MCLICEFGDIAEAGEFALERRAGDLAVAVVQLVRNEHERTPGVHLEEELINRGFSRLEIRDLRAPALTIVAKLHQAGLIDVEPVRAH